MTLPTGRPWAADIERVREAARLPEPLRMVQLRPILHDALLKIRTLSGDDRKAASAALQEAVRTPSTSAARLERIADAACVGDRTTW